MARTVVLSDERLRRMYAGGRGNPAARRFARVWARAFPLLPMTRRWVTFEVRGRKSGQPVRFPLGLADLGGHWYLVSMLGECNWTKNLRAAGGECAFLWHGRRWPQRATEVPVAQRAPILARYVETVPGGQPHIPVPVGAPLADFEAIADRYPVFSFRSAQR